MSRESRSSTNRRGLRQPSNMRVNLTVRPVTALAEGASAAPVLPAGYARR